MKRQVLVIGLGQFGMGLVRALSKENAEVMAIDSDPKKVAESAAFVDQALCFDATNADALAELMPQKRDVCICATGDQSKEVGIICTALLKQMGAKRIIARANDELHSRILKIVGADEVVNPEWDFGERYATRIMSEEVLAEMMLGSDLVITEFAAPQSVYNRSILDLGLRKKYNITIVAIRRGRDGSVLQAVPDYVIQKEDILIAVATKGTVQSFLSA